jgi:hypothetical protein
MSSLSHPPTSHADAAPQALADARPRPAGAVLPVSVGEDRDESRRRLDQFADLLATLAARAAGTLDPSPPDALSGLPMDNQTEDSGAADSARQGHTTP